MTATDSCLIGDSGLVGGNLSRAHQFDFLYNSRNIEKIRGRAFRFLVCAGTPSLKWHANANPGPDRASIERLIASLETVSAASFVLISTISVYSRPTNVDEDTPVHGEHVEPYGRHRLELESFVCSRFRQAKIIRLPGVFGPGLRKNMIYDLLRHDYSYLGSAESKLQFYDLTRLWGDVEKMLKHNVPILNLATQPVTLSELGFACLGEDIVANCGDTLVKEDVRTKYAQLWDSSSHYLYSRQDVLRDVEQFAERYRAGSRNVARVRE